MSGIDQLLSFNQSALNLRSYRQSLLASNIANSDTPHFKARDIDFKSALANSLSGKGVSGISLTTTAPGHLGGNGGSAAAGAAQYRAEYQSSVDGNTVNMDVERAAFAENATQVEAVLTFIRGQIRDMNLALQGQ